MDPRHVVCARGGRGRQLAGASDDIEGANLDLEVARSVSMLRLISPVCKPLLGLRGFYQNKRYEMSKENRTHLVVVF